MAVASATPLGRLSLPDPDASASSGSRPLPGIVFIHDVWGPSPHSENFSDRLADAGFGVLAIDFYRALGRRPEGDPGAFIRALDDTQIMADVAEGVNALGALPECTGSKIGVTGVCMGGMYALLAACEVSGLSAAAPFYGMLSYETGMLAEESGLDRSRKPRSPLEAAPFLSCPLLAFFGERDTFIPAADVNALRAAWPEDGPAAEIVTYAEAGHAFMNDTRPEAFNEAASEDAWERLRGFFAQHLA